MIRVPQIFACPVDSWCCCCCCCLFCFFLREGGVFALCLGRLSEELKFIKNDKFIVFLAVWILFLKFSGSLKSSLYQNCMKLKHCHIYLRDQLFLFCFTIFVGMDECSNIWKLVSFKYLRRLWSASLWFWESLGADHTIFRKNCVRVCFIIVFPMDFIVLWNWGCQGGVLKLMDNAQM